VKSSSLITSKDRRYGQVASISKDLLTICIGFEGSIPVAVPEILYDFPSLVAWAVPPPIELPCW
jgi:hypothetical protein